MRITFLGGTHEVTGSCFYLEACGKHILIDCGMEQGKDVFENQELPIPAGDVNAVLLTHAHMDHSGKLPILYKQGFQGEIHGTGATVALCNIMLRDSAHIQLSEAEWRNRKGKRSGGQKVSPTYQMDDVLSLLRKFVSHPYNEVYQLYEGIKIRFIDSGHLLGSSSIEIWITEGDVTKKVVFSGDIGNINQPLIKDPQYMKEADYVVMESTYGDRLHEAVPDYVKELSKVIQETFDRGGNVVIPSFAIGRTQILLYFIRKIKADGLVKGHPNFKVYVDSPLAIEATGIFENNFTGYYDEEAMELIHKGINPIKFAGLRTTITSEESKEINYDDDPKVIIAASGMADTGRIRHHLKHNLWREESTVLFVGHQSEGTLGKLLLDGATEVKLFGEPIQVRASVKRLGGFSGHADQKGLLQWIQYFDPKPKRVFVVHGDDVVSTSFAKHLNTLGYNAMAPYSGTCFDLEKNDIIAEANAVPITRETESSIPERSAFERLVNAGKRLVSLIQKNKKRSNKDIGKFADQINVLCDKWEQ